MARIEVPMPQMGESIAEGTVSKWLKQPGDAVERDEPVLEISTDKVDAEVPSPVAGTLAEILIDEGQTVEVGAILGYVESGAGQAEGDGQATASGGGADQDGAGAGAVDADGAAEVAGAAGVAEVAGDGTEPGGAHRPASPTGGDVAGDGREAVQSVPVPEAAASAGATVAAQATAPLPAGDAGSSSNGEATREERLRTKSTPVVRRIAEAEGIDLASVPGTGHLGRVTKDDILSFIEAGRTESDFGITQRDELAALKASVIEAGAGNAAAGGHGAGNAAAMEAGADKAARAPGPSAPAQAAAPFSLGATDGPDELWSRFYDEVEHPALPVGAGDRVEAMDKVRRLTARHMVLAKRVAPHVHSFIEVDFSAVDRIRRENREQWAARGVRVSYTAFVAWACARVLQDFPMVNGAVSGNNLIYRGAVNLGMAVDLDPGLIVPVVHDAGTLSLTGISRKMVDLADRARKRRLVPSEIQGGTFTITNPGVLGTLVGMPIIPQGTAAILGTGAIEKRVVVLADAESGQDVMAIRKRAYFSLGYDHRIVDGADAARFLSQLKELLEDFPAEA